MKNIIAKHAFLILSVGFVFGISAKSALAQNTINGLVFDSSRRPVSEIDVELLDEYERLIRSTKTKGSGLYIFQGLRQGIYYIRARVDGTNYKEAKERIQLGQGNRISQTSSAASGGESIQVNIILEFDSVRNNNNPAASNEIVFAQSVPQEAGKLYENALKNLEKKNQARAIGLLQKAIEVFPDYYLALDRLGNEYLIQGEFTGAETVLKKALEINPRSFSSSYGLAAAQFKLGKKNDAVKTIETAISLNPASVNSFFLLGKIQRELKEFKKAEVSLKKANELSKEALPDVHWELALLYYYNLKLYNEAAAELELYLKTASKSANKEQITKLIKETRDKANKKN